MPYYWVMPPLVAVRLRHNGSITAAAGGAAIGNGTLSNTAMTATPAAVTFTCTVAGTYTLTLTSNNPLGGPRVATNATTIVTVIADQVGTLSYPKATYCANGTDPTPTVTGGSADDEFHGDYRFGD